MTRYRVESQDDIHIAFLNGVPIGIADTVDGLIEVYSHPRAPKEKRCRRRLPPGGPYGTHWSFDPPDIP